jgi:hypothetical protein
MKSSDEIPPQIFARLQKHAVPLVDSLESVLNRILDFYEANSGQEPDDDVVTDGKIKDFPLSPPPNLTHTKILSAQFNRVNLTKAELTWNAILHQAVRFAYNKTKKHEDLHHIILVNFVFGKKENDGYRYLPDVNLSIQGQDANGAWKGTVHIAKYFGIPFEIVFAWRVRGDAAHPGITGRFSFKRVRFI